MVAEKADVFGGTSAWSGGWMWIPRNPLATRAGIVEESEASRSYLHNELGAQFDPAKSTRCSNMVRRWSSFSSARRRCVSSMATVFPIFIRQRRDEGRPFDLRDAVRRARTRTLIDKLRPPLDDVTIKGMAIASGQDLAHFFNATRSPRSARYVMRRLVAFAGTNCAMDARCIW